MPLFFVIIYLYFEAFGHYSQIEKVKKYSFFLGWGIRRGWSFGVISYVVKGAIPVHAVC